MFVAEGGKHAGELKSYITAIKVGPLADDMYFRQLLRKSVLEDPIMRTQCFKDEIDSNNWDLSKPLTVTGVRVGQAIGSALTLQLP